MNTQFFRFADLNVNLTNVTIVHKNSDIYGVGKLLGFKSENGTSSLIIDFSQGTTTRKNYVNCSFPLELIGDTFEILCDINRNNDEIIISRIKKLIERTYANSQTLHNFNCTNCFPINNKREDAYFE